MTGRGMHDGNDYIGCDGEVPKSPMTAIDQGALIVAPAGAHRKYAHCIPPAPHVDQTEINESQMVTWPQRCSGYSPTIKRR